MKPVAQYKAYIVDCDGTLYFQPPLRRAMALRLIGFSLTHPWRIKEIRALALYRKLHEATETADAAKAQAEIYAAVAKKYGYKEEKVREIVRYWMQERPLKLLPKYADAYLERHLKRAQSAGKRIYIYSNYPAKEKIKALGTPWDRIYSAEDRDFNFLKPSPEGISKILANGHLEKEDVLLIGDTYEKDGKCAENAGIDYILLAKRQAPRTIQYRTGIFSGK